MIKPLSRASELASARELRRSITDGQNDLSAHWLDATGSRVLAMESGRHLEVDEASAVSHAYAAAGIGSLVAILNDTLVIQDEAYVLDTSAQDLFRLSQDLIGVNFLLADSPGTRCILFTTDDFKLVAGPLDFVTQVAGEATSARETFESFAAEHLEDLQPALIRAQSYMNWVTNSDCGP